ncbi:hypothetical protein CEK25_004197 [Fusarium fujikuroi]|nr:hypothetical protein CEK25_004197 [Fusarium fujikuroi]
MAAGHTRYVRYIALALFTLTMFYFFSNSKIDTIPVPGSVGNFPGGPGSPSNQQQAPGTIPKSPDAGNNVNFPGQQAPVAEEGDTALTKDDAPAQKPAGDAPAVPAPQTPKEGPASGELAEAPLAMSPNDPGWSNLQGTAPGPRMNATFVTLARNQDVWEIAESIRQVEDRFNRRYNYDWVFLNDKPFDEQFKKVTTSLCSGKTHYGLIPEEHWSFPEWIDQEKARKVREDMHERKIIYGDSISYRHMCRFESGFFFRQELMMNYEYYWRVEPSVKLFCDIHYDPFRVMHENNKKYSFVLSLYEYIDTIPTLWASTNSLSWLRSKPYLDFFESLDKDGGFFYERWGDAPVHSIAAGLLLKKEQIHFFEDIAYYHVPFTHCPTDEQRRLDLRCHCNPDNNFDWKGYSCTSRFFELNGMEKPKGYEKQQ